ncbi:MAG: AtpZ/AtpI family protein [Chloroflexota bacterium]
MPALTTLQALGVVTQFGVTCAVAVGLGYFVGSWLDSLLGTRYLFTILLALGGMISAIAGTLQLLKYLKQRADNRNADT